VTDRQTDRPTDGQTDGRRHIARYSIFCSALINVVYLDVVQPQLRSATTPDR